MVQDGVPAYRVPVFDRMHRQLGDEGVGFRVLVGTAGDVPAAPWAALRPARRWEAAGTEFSWMPVWGDLRHVDLVIVQQELSLLLNYPLLLRQHVGGPRVAFFGHGRTPPVRWGGGASYRSHVAPGTADRVKAAVARQVHWWFPYNQLSADIVTGFGFPADRITDVRNAIDTTSLRAALARQPDRSTLRRELGLGRGPVAVYCGRLYAEKRIAFLVEAATRVRERIATFELVVVGDGPDAHVITEAARTRSWIHPVGAREGDDKVPWFAAADVSLVPGNVGLAVLDALAMETPIVTSRSSDHGPEFAYLREGGNGVVSDDGGDPRRFGDAVADLLAAPDRLTALRAGCREDAGRYSVEDMSARFTAGILAAIAAPRRGPVAQPR